MSIEEYRRILPQISEINNNVEGHLTIREANFLALVAACPTAEGVILEIGSFKGRSTVILCLGKSIHDQNPLVSIDPLTSPSPTDPDLQGMPHTAEDFYRTLERYGVKDQVEFHQCLSHEVAKEWNRPIRFLWIDGDHTYGGVKLDFDNFSPYLADGAIIALHDILIGYDGPIRVFMEDILLSENFCAAGLWGSIGWAQYRREEKANTYYQRQKSKLYKKLAPLVPLYVYKDCYSGKWSHLKYRILRARTPHRGINPEEWIKEVKILD